MADSTKKAESQADKFREAARKVKTDDREEAFDEKLRRVAKLPEPKDGKETLR